MNDLVTKILRGKKVIQGRDFYQFRQVKRNRLKYGNRYADWTFCPDSLSSESVVYSFGVGEDISFDLELMDHFQMPVHAFDPSPRSIDWVQKQDLPSGFHFHPYGLGTTDGEISFSEPVEQGVHSLHITGGPDDGDQSNHVLPVHRLKTIVEKLGHSTLDILKMDIEGAEYDVIGDIISLQIPVSQVLIEFHHRLGHIGIRKTRQAIAQMNQAGYRIFNVSSSGEEISFIKNSE